MTRLLVFGFSPLPFENTRKNFGPGIRVWQFIQPLIQTGQVEVTLVANRIPYIYPDSMPPEVFSNDHGFSYYCMTESIFRQTARIQEIHDRVQPDAILVATVFAGMALTGLQTQCPIWFDLFGHVMAEAQAKAYRYDDDSYLEHFRQHSLMALRSADQFSTVSKAQSHATIGELGLIRRLTAATTGFSFCHTIPCAMEPSLLSHPRTMIRGKEVPENAFVILWSGGYNTWTDIDTLADGIESAMSRNPDIWFVSTGGQIDGHDELTYPAFVRRVEKSDFSRRFVLKGWVPKDDVQNYYFEANIGINIDRYMYEGMFGSKNRVLDWLRAGLPALMGELCELSYELPALGLGYSYPLGDAEALAEKILTLASDPEAVAATGRRAQTYGLEHLSFSRTTEPFRQWLANPRFAPDRLTQSDSLQDPLQIRSYQYAGQLEAELAKKNDHIISLEHYIRHLEHEIEKHQSQPAIPSQSSIHRPVMKGLPMPLPDNPRLSVILVTWNGIRDIEPCLQSVIHHDYPEIDCVVVDNASTDGTPEFIAEHFPMARIIRNTKNRGFTGGVNQGIAAAQGDVIFLLNQDAVMLPGLLNELVKSLQDDSIAIAGCKIYNPDGRTIQHAGGILHENCLTDHYGAGQLDSGQFDEDRDVEYVTGAAFAFKRKVIDEIGLFDPRFSPAYFEELDFCTRAIRSGYRVRYCHRATALHHESTSTGKFSRRFYRLYHRNRLKFVLKHYTLRYFWGRFRRSEWHWLQKYAPKEQILPLLGAYLRVGHRILWLSVRGIIRRKGKR